MGTVPECVIRDEPVAQSGCRSSLHIRIPWSSAVVFRMHAALACLRSIAGEPDSRGGTYAYDCEQYSTPSTAGASPGRAAAYQTQSGARLFRSSTLQGLCMNLARPRSLPADSYLAWSRLAWETGEMLLAASQVICYRTQRIATAGAIPNARDRREFILMGQEKIDAATASLQAASMQLLVMNTKLAALAFNQSIGGANGLLSAFIRADARSAARAHAALLSDTLRNSARLTSRFSGSMSRVVRGGLRPFHSRATGNARRLSKRR